MKNFILLLMLLVVGCSDNKNQVVEQPNFSNKEYLKSAQISGSTDFGIFNDGSSKLLTYKITNNGSESLIGPATISGTDFLLSYQSGCTNLLPTKSCTIKVSFNSKNKNSGVYNTNLTLDSVTFSLQATVQSAAVTDSENVVFSPTSLDFGILQQNSSVLKTILLKNISTKSINKTVSLSSNQYVITYDACSGKNLGVGATCSIKITLSGAGKSGIIQDILTFGDISTTLSLTGEVQSPPPSDIRVYNEIMQEVTGFVNFGLLEQNTSVIKTLTVKNNGGSDGNINLILTGDSNYSLSYNNCPQLLKPTLSCLVKVKMNAPISSNPQSNGNISSLGLIGAGPSTQSGTAITGQLQVNETKNVQLQGEISNITILPIVEFVTDNQIVELLDYSTIEYNGSLFKTIYVKNKGSVDLIGVPELMTATGTGFNISYTNCSGVIKPSQQCMIRLGIVGFGSTPGQKQNILKLGSSMLAVTGTINYPPINCPIGQEPQAGVCRDIIVLSKISIGTAHACSLDGNKYLRCWGANYFGQLGINSLVDSSYVKPVAGVLNNTQIDQVVAFGANTCALAAGKVYCWGYGYYGGVGNGSQNDSLVPVEISTANAFNGRTIVQLVGGGYGNTRICGLDSAGGAVCWGQGPFGPRPTPVDINSQPYNGFGFGGILTGQAIDQFFLDSYSFAAIVNGVGYGWGGNFPGDGVNSSIYTPQLLGTQLGFVNQTVQQIAHGNAGANHCVLASGKVYCWGNNGNGEMGDGITHTIYEPYLAPKETLLYSVTNNKLSSEIAVGDGFACALVESKVYCWGKNNFGQLGNGNNTNKNIPELVGIGSSLEGKVVQHIYASGNNACASTNEGKTYCWGYNGNGELGRGFKGGSSNLPAETILNP